MEENHCYSAGSGIQGFRKYMEDELLMYKIQGICVFAVFDGHGGKDVSEYLKSVFIQLINVRILPFINSEDEVLKTEITRVFCDVDKEIERRQFKGGSTANILIVTDEKYICINLGDSRCILCKNNDNNEEENPEYSNNSISFPIFNYQYHPFYTKFKKNKEILCIPLSIDHKPKRDLKRVCGSGGVLYQNRVLYNDNLLSMSRSFGDLVFKSNKNLSQEDQIVNCIPEIVIRNRESNDIFIVLGTDGLFDVLSNNNIINYINHYLKQNKALEQILVDLITISVNVLCSGDNVSSIIVKLNDL